MYVCSKCGTPLIRGKVLGVRIQARVDGEKNINAMPRCYVCPACGDVSIYIDEKNLKKNDNSENN